MGGLGVNPAVPPLVRRISNVMMDIAGIYGLLEENRG